MSLSLLTLDPSDPVTTHLLTVWVTAEYEYWVLISLTIYFYIRICMIVVTVLMNGRVQCSFLFLTTV